MLKKMITYTDYNGLERTEPFYFNLTKAEILKMEFGSGGDLAEKLQRLVDSKKVRELMDFFNEFILKAYGEKSDDGIHFRKSSQISQDFEASAAYNELYVELLTDADKAAEFVKACLPAEIQKSAEFKLYLEESKTGKSLTNDHKSKVKSK